MYLEFVKKGNEYKIKTTPKYSEVNSEFYIEYEGYDLVPLVEQYFKTRGTMTESDVRELCFIHKRMMILLVDRPDKVKEVSKYMLPELMFPHYVNVRENLTYVNANLAILYNK